MLPRLHLPIARITKNVIEEMATRAIANIEKRLPMADSSGFFLENYFSYFETDAVMIQRSLTTKSSRVFEEKQDSFEGFRYCNTGCSNILST